MTSTGTSIFGRSAREVGFPGRDARSAAVADAAVAMLQLAGTPGR
jgi:hypothetical protein